MGAGRECPAPSIGRRWYRWLLGIGADKVLGMAYARRHEETDEQFSQGAYSVMASIQSKSSSRS
jgi:hypothetical protein